MTIRHLTFPLLTTRAAGDGTHRTTITTRAPDRMGDVLEPKGARTANWERAGRPINFAHRHDELPIGRGLSLIPTADGIDMTFRFLDGDEFAERAENAWRQGALAGASVGLLPLKVSPLPSGRGLHIEEWELLEVSLTATPANPDCVATLKSLGLPVADAEEIVLALDEPADGPAPPEAPADVVGYETMAALLEQTGSSVTAAQKIVAGLIAAEAPEEAQLAALGALMATAGVALEAVARLAEALSGADEGEGDDEPDSGGGEPPEEPTYDLDPAEIARATHDALYALVERETKKALNAIRGRID